MNLGHWITDLKDIPEDFFGFVYKITNLETNKCYIGKKQTKNIRKGRLKKGKKRREITIAESDWKTYTGSSNKLNEDIEKLGKDKFKFEIIKICSCKWELAYFEAEEQFANKVLLYPDKFYNSIINLRLNKAPKNILNEFRDN